MPVLEIESRGMATKRREAAREKDLRPEDEVRFLAIMTRDERARLKSFCARIGANMERLGAQWIVERLAQEERKLSK